MLHRLKSNDKKVKFLIVRRILHNFALLKINSLTMKNLLLLITICFHATMFSQVGIGTETPTSTLDVNGEIEIGNSNAACTNTNEGAMRYNQATSQIQFCDGTAWVSLKINNASSAYASINQAVNPPLQNIGNVFETLILPDFSTTGSAIKYNNATGVFTLEANRTYALTASINHTNDQYSIIRWYNATTNEILGTISQMSPQDATMPDDAVGNSFVHYIFTPNIQTQVVFQAKSAAGNLTAGFYNGEGLRAPFASIHTID